MTYEALLDFVQNRMRMSHVYQPVMIMTLLQNQGHCSTRSIAKAILANDESQIEYYEGITRNMVGRVLTRHGIVSRHGKEYVLSGHEALTEEQARHIVEVCEQKLNQYIEKRGEWVWQHRRLSLAHISGTLKYEVLRKAQFHCELCGISADIKALEVDHIIPRNHGGTDDLSNLQALCYSCNAMKRDRDSTDFRKVKESYKHREDACLFCTISTERIIAQNDLAYAVRDAFPATPLHTLVIPKRHSREYFELGRPEINACNLLLQAERSSILTEDSAVQGFNIGINNGEVAGQTIFHCHIHLIPRRKGDVSDPRGGVRHLLPGKGYYQDPPPI